LAKTSQYQTHQQEPCCPSPSSFNQINAIVLDCRFPLQFVCTPLKDLKLLVASDSQWAATSSTNVLLGENYSRNIMQWKKNLTQHEIFLLL
jgi:hypothetical protein